MAGPVLTVSTQPVRKDVSKLFDNQTLNEIHLFIPGMGSFPCLFKKAEYASMNFCACTTNQISIIPSTEVIPTPSRLLICVWMEISSHGRGVRYCASSSSRSECRTLRDWRNVDLSAEGLVVTHVNIAD